MAKYKISGSGVIDTENNSHIPNDSRNYHWREYQDWVELGNTPDPEFTEQQILDNVWNDLRSERNSRLTATDFMMTYDFYTNILTSQQQTDVTTYRQTLRDLPENTIDPSDPTWPVKPQIILDYGI